MFGRSVRASRLTFVRLAHFIMPRKQLSGIASRAESPQRIENHDMPTEAA
jgi:hypothetical protein